MYASINKYAISSRHIGKNRGDTSRNLGKSKVDSKSRDTNIGRHFVAKNCITFVNWVKTNKNLL